MEVLEAARRAGNPHVIYASSSAVYGVDTTTPAHEMLAPAPLSPYAAGKLAGESYALAYQHSFGLPTLALRFFNVFGPWQSSGHPYAAVIPAFVEAALTHQPLSVNGDGRQSRDFTSVDTVTAIIADAITREVRYSGPVNLASGTSTDLCAIIDQISAIVGRTLTVVHRPELAGDVRHSHADCDQLTKLFPDVGPIPLQEALKETISWYDRELNQPTADSPENPPVAQESVPQSTR